MHFQLSNNKAILFSFYKVVYLFFCLVGKLNKLINAAMFRQHWDWQLLVLQLMSLVAVWSGATWLQPWLLRQWPLHEFWPRVMIFIRGEGYNCCKKGSFWATTSEMSVANDQKYLIKGTISFISTVHYHFMPNHANSKIFTNHVNSDIPTPRHSLEQ